MNETLAVSDGIEGVTLEGVGDAGQLRALLTTLEVEGGHPEALLGATLAWARAADREGLPDAEAALSLALTRALDPVTRSHLNAALARHAAKDGDVERALRYLESAIEDAEDDGQSIDLMLTYGDIAHEAKQHADAVRSWTKALELMPAEETRRVDIHRALAAALESQGLTGPALHQLDAARHGATDRVKSDIDLEAANVLERAGRNRESTARRDAAIADLLRTREPSTSLALALETAATVAARNRAPADVRKLVSRAIQIYAQMGVLPDLIAAYDRTAHTLDQVSQFDQAQDHIAWATALRRGDPAPPWTSMQAAASTVCRPRSLDEAEVALVYLKSIANLSADAAMRDAAVRMLVDALPWALPGPVAEAIGALIGAGSGPWPHHVVRAQLSSVMRAAAPFAATLRRYAGDTAVASVTAALWRLARSEQPASEAAWLSLGPCARGYAAILGVASEARQAARADTAFLETLQASRIHLRAVEPVANILDAFDREEIIVIDVTHGASWRVSCTGVLTIAQLIVLFETAAERGGDDAQHAVTNDVLQVARGRKEWEEGLRFTSVWAPYTWLALRDGLELTNNASEPAPHRHRVSDDDLLKKLPRMSGRPVLVLVETPEPETRSLPRTADMAARLDRVETMPTADHLRWLDRIANAHATFEFKRLDDRALLAAAADAENRGEAEAAIGILQWALAQRDATTSTLDTIEPMRRLVSLHASLEEWEAAADAARHLFAQLERGTPPDYTAQVAALLDLGLALERCGDRPTATHAFERAQRLAVRHPGGEHATLVLCHRRWADWLVETGRAQAATGHLEQAASLLASSSDPTMLADTLRALAAMQVAHSGQPLAAVHTMYYVIEARRSALGDAHPDLAADFRDLARLLDAEGRHAEAQDARHEARTLLAATWYTIDERGLVAMTNDLDAHVEQGDEHEAAWIAERAWQTSISVLGANHPDTLALAALLADLLNRIGRDDLAGDVLAQTGRSAWTNDEDDDAITEG